MDWRQVPFAKVVQSRGVGPKSLPRSDWKPTGQYPVIGQGAEEIEGWSDRDDLVVQPNPSLVLYGGHTRRAKFIDMPFIPGPNVKLLKPTPVVDPRYLFWFLTQIEIADRGYADHFPQVRESLILLPTLPEQRRIAEILDQADRLRRLRAEADAKAGRILAVLFIRMFGDPATNPMGWPRLSLGSQSTIVTGNTPSTKQPEYYGGSLPWARPADLDQSPLVRRTDRQLSARGRTAARVVPANSVLVVCIGATLGKVGLAGVEMAINQQINAVLPSATLTPEFLFVQCALSADRLRARATKSTLPILNKSQFSSHEVLVPPVELQESF